MKRIILVLIIFSSYPSFSQDKSNDISILYDLAIESHLKILNNFIDKGILNLQIKDLYFLADEVSQEYLPTKTGNFKIEYIDIYNKENRKLLKKGIKAISIKPIRLVNGEIIITLIDFSVTLCKKNFKFINSGGSTTVFKYSCSKNEWVLKENKYSEI